MTNAKVTYSNGMELMVNDVESTDDDKIWEEKLDFEELNNFKRVWDGQCGHDKLELNFKIELV